MLQKIKNLIHGKISGFLSKNESRNKLDSDFCLSESAKKYLKTHEKGRSMVEMLGVLAVIGVLTLGGLAGYNYAMNKHRANTILSEISLRYIVAQQQLTVGTPLNMSEFSDTILGDYKIDVYEPEGKDGVVAFQLSNIPVDVAKQLFSSGSVLWKLPITYFSIDEQEGVVASSGYSYPKPISEAMAKWDVAGINTEIVSVLLYMIGSDDPNSCKSVVPRILGGK